MIVALMNKKGGTGKTTITVNLGAAVAKAGARVLLVDSDPQRHTTLTLLGMNRTFEKSLSSVLMAGDNMKSAIVAHSKNLDIVPSMPDLSETQVLMQKQNFRESLLSKALKSVEKSYDYIFIDCPPNLDVLTVNALVAADKVIVPMEPEFLPLEGLAAMSQLIDEVRANINKNLSLAAIVINKYNPSRRLTHESEALVRKQFGAKVMKTVIRIDVRIAEAPSAGQSVLDYAPDSHGTEDFKKLAREVLICLKKK